MGLLSCSVFSFLPQSPRQNQIKTRDRFANKILDSLVALQQMTRGGLFTDESARASFA